MSAITSSETMLGSLLDRHPTGPPHVEFWKLVSIIAVEVGPPQLDVYRPENLPVRVPGLLVQYSDLFYQGLAIHPVSTIHLVLAEGRFLIPPC